MKMKGKVFGNSVKLALAVLVVFCTMFTSCYEKEEIDTTTVAPAAYYVVGSISDGSDGQPITTATVKIDGTAVTLTNGAFIQEVTASGAHTVAVTADGYYDVTKTVYCVVVADGQTSVAVADIALFTPDSQVTAPTETTTPSANDITDEIQTTVEDNFIPETAPTGTTMGTSTVTVTDGTIVITTPLTLSTATVDPVEVSYTYNEGFAFTETPATRSVTDLEQFIANVANQLNKSYGLTKVTKTTTLYEGGNSIYGYNVIYTINLQEYIFLINGANWGGIATWQSNVRVAPLVDTHDSHDTHGDSTNSGGGSGSAE
jgi:hypothetical protein